MYGESCGGGIAVALPMLAFARVGTCGPVAPLTMWAVGGIPANPCTAAGHTPGDGEIAELLSLDDCEGVKGSGMRDCDICAGDDEPTERSLCRLRCARRFGTGISSSSLDVLQSDDDVRPPLDDSAFDDVGSSEPGGVDDPFVDDGMPLLLLTVCGVVAEPELLCAGELEVLRSWRRLSLSAIFAIRDAWHVGNGRVA